MALPIRDGNQSLTTLSTILVSNSHIPAHTVVSFGAQGITDIATAVSGVELGPNTLNALENITVTLGQVTITGGLTDAQLRASAVTVGGGIYIADAQSVIGSSIPPEVVQIGGKSLADSKLYPISVDSNGVQSISGAVTASISGTPSVTFGTAVITGSTSILNFPATQTVTFTQAPVTFGTAIVTGSVSVLNIPATQTVTFSQAPVTFGTAVVTGSTSILNFPATQTVTFGTSVITGSVSVLNIPATQTVTFTQASVTFGQPTITGSVSVLNFPASQSVTFTTATVTFGTAVITGSASIIGTPSVTFTQAAVTFSAVSISNFPATQPVSIASVTIGNTVTIAGTVTIGSLPAIFADPSGFQSVVAGILDAEVNTIRSVLWIPQENGSDGEMLSQLNPLPISGTVTVGNTVKIAGTVTANPTGSQTIAGTVTANGGDFASQPLGAYPSKALRIGFADDENYYAVGLAGGGNPLPVILYNTSQDPIGSSEAGSVPLVISGTVTIGSALPAGTNRIGVVTIGAGTVTIGAGISQIGSVTASISGTVPISISSVTIGNSVTIGSLPAISGTVTANVFGKDANSSATPQIPVIAYDEGITAANFGYVVPVQVTNVGGQISEANPLPISGTVTANTFAVQGTAVTTSNFTSTTASTVLAGFNATREVLTIFNEGAGNLHVCAGATCTTIAYQVRLSAGDYYEVPNHQTTITHSAVFAAAGTARVTEVS